MPITDPDRKRAYDAAYYVANIERLKERSRQYHVANRERISERRDIGRRMNPEIALLRSAKDRAKRYGVPFDLGPDDIIVPEKCPVLGIPLSKGSGTSGPNSP